MYKIKTMSFWVLFHLIAASAICAASGASGAFAIFAVSIALAAVLSTSTVICKVCRQIGMFDLGNMKLPYFSITILQIHNHWILLKLTWHLDSDDVVAGIIWQYNFAMFLPNYSRNDWCRTPGFLYLKYIDTIVSSRSNHRYAWEQVTLIELYK